MALRVGFLGVAHLHAWSYASVLREHHSAEVVGAWDSDAKRLASFSQGAGIPSVKSADELLGASDAVIIASANTAHAGLIELATAAGKAMLCEKPLVTTEAEADRVRAALAGSSAFLMTAFPCRFAPSYLRLKERVKNGDIGAIQAVCATNRGQCPFDWFVDVSQSGGGAMMDHTVHVADLLLDLLGEQPASVMALVGSNMYGESWDDSALLTLQFSSGVFATIDASWSRPKSYKTWGDVTMNVIGDKGVIELNMFAQQAQVYRNSQPSHTVADYGSHLDGLMLEHFLTSVEKRQPPITSLEDGLRASRIAIAGYQSAKQGQPAVLSNAAPR